MCRYERAAARTRASVGRGCAPRAWRLAAQMAVSVVMNSVVPSAPPKVKLTVPGSRISPIRSPAGENTCTPLEADTYTWPVASTLMPSGKPGVMTANSRALARWRPHRER